MALPDDYDYNVFLTNVNQSGDDLMVFTTIEPKELIRGLKIQGKITFDEGYEVPARDVQHYIYEPCYLDVANEKFVRDLLEKHPQTA